MSSKLMDLFNDVVINQPIKPNENELKIVDNTSSLEKLLVLLHKKIIVGKSAITMIDNYKDLFDKNSQLLIDKIIKKNKKKKLSKADIIKLYK